MTDRIYVGRTGPSTSFWLEADVVSQSTVTNQSVIRCYLRAANGPGGNSTSRWLNWGAQVGYIDGYGEFGRHEANPFLPSGYAANQQRWRDGHWDVTVTHNSSGYLTVTLRMKLAYDGDNDYTANFTLPRIARAPLAPSTPTVGATTPTSVALTWTAPDDMGAAISGYTVQYATDAGFTTGVGTQTFGGAAGTVTGLAPGATYWFRVRATNSVGTGPYGGSASVAVGLPAPTILTWAQNIAGELVATWSAPAVTTGLTGYRVTIATDAAFTQNVINTDIGNVLTYARAGLAGGRRYWAKVAARTAGGTNTFSASLDTLLVLDAGDLDGWTRVGTKPAGISYFTVEGIRRGVSGGAQALILESLSTAAATLGDDEFGIERVVTGLTVGKSYRFEASMTGGFTAAPDATQGSTYRLGIDGTLSDPAELPSATGTIALPLIEFVAASTTATLSIILATGLTVSGAQNEVERVAFHGIVFAELDTDYPQRLRDTVYESNLANHFDLACNSVGATWFVGKDGVTRFNLPGAALPVSAVFSDERGEGLLEYIDVAAGYDTLTTVNQIEATNYGETAGLEDNDIVVVESVVSQSTFGVRQATLDVNLYDEAPYDTALADRLTDLLDRWDEPELVISSIRWNAQQDLTAAAALEIGQRILVRYRGIEQDSQIITIDHDIQPSRWIITFTLQKL